MFGSWKVRRLNRAIAGLAHSLHLLTGWIIAGPVLLTMKRLFPRFFYENHLLRAYYLRFDWSGWIVLIKSEIPIATGIVWPVSSDKRKAPLVSFATARAGVAQAARRLPSHPEYSQSKCGFYFLANAQARSACQSLCSFYLTRWRCLW